MDDKHVTIKKIIFEAINKNSRLTLKDLKNILEIDFIKNNLDKIIINDIYEINNTNKKDMKTENINELIKDEDKEDIKNIILDFMDYNSKYKFSEIKYYLYNNFKKYKIKDSSILGLLNHMKNKKIIIYKSGKWILNL